MLETVAGRKSAGDMKAIEGAGSWLCAPHFPKFLRGPEAEREDSLLPLPCVLPVALVKPG